MGTCVHFSRSLPSNSWWQTMVGGQVLSRPSAPEGGGRRPAVTGLATQPYSATEVDGWQHKLRRVSQNRAAVHFDDCAEDHLLKCRGTVVVLPDSSKVIAHRTYSDFLFRR